jgi:hypothetical protein
VNPNLLASGEETFPREAVGTTATMTSGMLRLSFFTATKTETVTSLACGVGSTAAAATPSLIRFGVYSVAENGDLTLIASTANDTALLATTFAKHTKALSESWSKTAGTRYAIGLLVVTGATAPIVSATAGNPGINARAPRLTGSLTGQTDLPASVDNASIVNTGAAPLFLALTA